MSANEQALETRKIDRIEVEGYPHAARWLTLQDGEMTLYEESLDTTNCNDGASDQGILAWQVWRGHADIAGDRPLAHVIVYAGDLRIVCRINYANPLSADPTNPNRLAEWTMVEVPKRVGTRLHLRSDGVPQKCEPFDWAKACGITDEIT